MWRRTKAAACLSQALHERALDPSDLHTRVFFRKIQEGKLWQKTSGFSLLLVRRWAITRKHCPWFHQLDCISVAFLLVNLPQFLGKRNIPLLSTSKQIFPKLFTESDKPNGKCGGYEKEEENTFFYFQTGIMQGRGGTGVLISSGLC